MIIRMRVSMMFRPAHAIGNSSAATIVKRAACKLVGDWTVMDAGTGNRSSTWRHPAPNRAATAAPGLSPVLEDLNVH